MSRRATASKVEPCPNSTPKHATHKRPPHAHEGSGHGDGHRRLKQLLLVLCAAQLMVILDITAVNVALPDMAKGLGIDGGDIGWTITSYSLIFGSLLLLGGRAADLVGPRRMFMTGLGLFTCRFGRGGDGRERGRALRRAGRPGTGRGDALPGRALDPDEHLP